MNKQKSAAEFILRLKDLFCSGLTLERGTIDEYTRKLSGYSLTSEQWQKAFDVLAERHQQRGLPALGLIVSAIREAQAPARYQEASRKGKMIFRTVDGHEYALIVRLESGVGGDYWAIASVTTRRGGETVELQKHIGMEALARLSLIPGAQLVGIFPDDRSLIAPGEMPTAEELAEYHASVASLK